MRDLDPRGRAGGARALVLVLVLALAAVTAGCDTTPEDPDAAWRDAVPSADALMYVFPDVDPISVEAGALGVTTGALVGEESELWAAARDTTRTVNLALAAFLAPVQRLMRDAAPERTAPNRVAWRGAAPGGLDEDLLVVERADDGHFEYTLWSRERLRPNAAWRFRLFGSTTPIDGPRRGRGVLWVDLEGDRRPRSRGKVLALWENLPERREVAVTFFAASPDDAATPARTKSFLFTRTAAGSLLGFGPESVDVHDTPGERALEEVRVLSRWNAQGVGRSDAAITGGDVASAGNALVLRTECWRSPDHAVRYEATFVRRRTASGPGPLTLASEAGFLAACPQAVPEVPVLPEIGAEPEVPPLPPEASEDAG